MGGRGAQAYRAGEGSPADFKAGSRASISAAPAAAASSPRLAAGTRPCPGAQLLQARPEEAGRGRRGRGRDLGPGGSAGGHEGAYYHEAEPGFQKFLLVLWKFRRRSPEGGQNSHLGEKARDRACRRNRPYGVLRIPPSRESWLQERQGLPSLAGGDPSAFQLRDLLSAGEIWNRTDLGSVQALPIHSFIQQKCSD